MDPTSHSLDIIDVASPCSAPWDSMTGNDQVRHCDRCDLNVYNLSAMTRDEAEQLVFQHEGRLCVGFFRRADGTVITKDCPVGARALRRKLARLVASVGAIIALLVTGGAMARENTPTGTNSSATVGPLTRLSEWISPLEEDWIEGEICVPTLPAVSAPISNGGITSQPTPDDSSVSP